jgi:hypothetical protein
MKGSFDKIMKSKPRRFSLLDLYRVFLGFAIIEGALALWFFLRIRYSTKQFLIFNHSLQHLIIGAAILLAVGIFVFLLVDSLSSRKVLKNLELRIETLLRIDISHPILKTSLIVIVLICGIASLSPIFNDWYSLFPTLISLPISEKGLVSWSFGFF